VFVALNEQPTKCPQCGQSNGQIVSNDHLEKRLKSGMYFNTAAKAVKDKKKP
jgi:hypothetical protein